MKRTANFAKREVERERDERSLQVITDARIRGILVLSIELDPRIEARIGDALKLTTGGSQNARDQASKQLEIASLVDQRRSDECQVIVVRREALERPELPRVILLGEVVRRERRRLDAFDVPA